MVPEIGEQGQLLVALLVSTAVALIGGVLLFRHIDMLILKRIAQAQQEDDLSITSA